MIHQINTRVTTYAREKIIAKSSKEITAIFSKMTINERQDEQKSKKNETNL